MPPYGLAHTALDAVLLVSLAQHFALMPSRPRFGPLSTSTCVSLRHLPVCLLQEPPGGWSRSRTGQTVEHHQSQPRAAGLLVHADGRPQRRPQARRVRVGSPTLASTLRCIAAVASSSRPAAASGGVHHADGHRVPVPERCPRPARWRGRGYARSSGSPAGPPRAGRCQTTPALTRIARSTAREHGAVRHGGAIGVRRHQVQDDRVGDEAGLDHPGRPAR